MARIPVIDTLGLIDRILAPVTWVAAGLVVLLLFVGPSLIGADKGTAAKPAAAAGTQAAVSGAQVFDDNGCGGCHTLKAAGASGAIGPNLDETKLDAAGIEQIVTGGRGLGHRADQGGARPGRDHRRPRRHAVARQRHSRHAGSRPA